MPFDREIYCDCNYCDDANFNLENGVYTNGWPGTYTVTWDLYAVDDHRDHLVEIYLKKNGDKIYESRHVSKYTGSSGLVDDQGELSLASLTECLLNFILQVEEL